MIHLASIDPGVKYFGFALWTPAGKLVRAELLKTGYEPLAYDEYCIETLVIEVPQVYVRSRSKANPQDLIDLAFAAGRIAEAFEPGEIKTVRPAVWKKQVDKKVMVERIKKRLTAEESINVVEAKQKALMHNVHDSIGIGLHFFGRL